MLPWRNEPPATTIARGAIRTPSRRTPPAASMARRRHALAIRAGSTESGPSIKGDESPRRRPAGRQIREMARPRRGMRREARAPVMRTIVLCIAALAAAPAHAEPLELEAVDGVDLP